MIWKLLLISAWGMMPPIGDYPSREACEAALRQASYSGDLGGTWRDAEYFVHGDKPSAICLPVPK